MNTKQLRTIFVICLVVICLIGFSAFMLMLAGGAQPFVKGIAADSDGRVYIGMDSQIQVYDHNEYIGSISAQTSKGYAFTINEDDTILLSTAVTAYTIDLQGNVLNAQHDTRSRTFRSLEKQKNRFVSPNGDVYELTDVIGWTRVIKNGTDEVYRISGMSFVAKVLLYAFVLSLPPIVLCAICNEAGILRKRA